MTNSSSQLLSAYHMPDSGLDDFRYIICTSQQPFKVSLSFADAKTKILGGEMIYQRPQLVNKLARAGTQAQAHRAPKSVLFPSWHGTPGERPVPAAVIKSTSQPQASLRKGNSSRPTCHLMALGIHSWTGTPCLHGQGKESLDRQAGWELSPKSVGGDTGGAQLLWPVALSELIDQNATGLSKCTENTSESAFKNRLT